MNKTEDFIKKSKLIHGDKYNYNRVNYIDNITKVEIICDYHMSFFQIPQSHKNGSGCPKCGVLSMRNKKTDNNNIWLSDFFYI